MNFGLALLSNSYSVVTTLQGARLLRQLIAERLVSGSHSYVLQFTCSPLQPNQVLGKHGSMQLKAHTTLGSTRSQLHALPRPARVWGLQLSTLCYGSFALHSLRTASPVRTVIAQAQPVASATKADIFGPTEQVKLRRLQDEVDKYDQAYYNQDRPLIS